MPALNLIVFIMGIVGLVASFLWTTYRWSSRGGLKVPFFQDELYRTVSIVASGVLAICALTVLGINVALLCSASGDSAPAASNIILFVLSSVLVTVADVEGCYGNGVYARNGSHLVKVAWGEIVADKDRVQIVLEGESRERSFLATKRTRAALNSGLAYGFWERISQALFDDLLPLFHDDAVISLPNTQETFLSPSHYIAFNKAYPGSWQAEVLRMCPGENSAVTFTKVSSRGEALSFHVASFFEFRHGKIQTLEEYWGENGSPPDWRKDGLYTTGTTP